MPSDDKRIIDNPSPKKLLESLDGLESLAQLLPILEAFGFQDDGVKEALGQVKDLKKQAHILRIPDQFNAHFAKVGWVAYESFNLNLMRQAVELADAGQHKEAEQLLADYFDEENLEWLLMRMWGLEEFRPRDNLAQLAKDDYLAGRYHACIPSLLMLIDGLVNDIEQTGFFAEGTDLTAWDSIAGHSSGLKALSDLFSTNRKKTTTEPITIPYRNGILHGRDLNYANKIVAAKCWAALFAVRDWAQAIKEGKKNPQPQEPEPSLSESLQKWYEVQNFQKRIGQWTKRTLEVGTDIPESGKPEDYGDRTPEKTFVEFMQYWMKNNYGDMSVIIHDAYNRPKNKRAREVKMDFQHAKPISFRILSLTDTAPVMTHILVNLTYKLRDEEKNSELKIEMIHQDNEGNSALRDDLNGTWYISALVQPHYLSQT
jgi:hypothetical protein